MFFSFQQFKYLSNELEQFYSSSSSSSEKVFFQVQVRVRQNDRVQVRVRSPDADHPLSPYFRFHPISTITGAKCMKLLAHSFWFTNHNVFFFYVTNVDGTCAQFPFARVGSHAVFDHANAKYRTKNLFTQP